MTPRLSILVSLFLWLAAHAFAVEAPLTRVEDIRRLSREASAKAVPVKIVGVCVFSGGDIVVHDGERSIWIAIGGANRSGVLKAETYSMKELVVGAQVEVTGFTNAGDYGPLILPTAIRRIGTLPVPPVPRVPMERLLSGSEDGQMVEVEGVVQSILPQDRTALMMVDGHLCRLSGVWGRNADESRMVDARVRIRGVFAPGPNARSEAAILKIDLSGAQGEVEIVTPPPPEPFLAPKVALTHLMPFSPDAQPYHRKVIEGVVIFAIPGRFFFLQEGETSLRVEAASREVRVGQQVEVAGFVDTSYTFASLKNALVRTLGSATVPAPKAVTVAKILDPAAHTGWVKPSSDDLSGHAVILRGQIDRVGWKEDKPMGKVPETVWIKSDGRSFPAFLPLTQSIAAERADSWIPGAEVELTGICELEFPDKGVPESEYRSNAFHLWLAGPEQIRVTRLPPWWTAFRLSLALGGVGLLLLLVLGWTWMLRREVEKQTRIISEKGRMEATNAERARIARDMHDDIGSRLARLSVLGELIIDEPSMNQNERLRVQELARGVREAAGELEQIIWSVDPKHDTLNGLAHRICQYTEEYFSETPVRCLFEELPEIPDAAMRPDERAAVFSAVKEALANVLKHSGASVMNLGFRVHEHEFEIRIGDNGCGMALIDAAVAAGNGLANMRQRLAALGGQSRIESTPGCGSTVILRWSWKKIGAQLIPTGGSIL